MDQCLDAIEARLTDLLQTGLDTGAGDSAADFGRLAEQCEVCGLHTGRTLMEHLAQLLDARVHTLEKQDGPLLDAVFQAERYITLCRERWQEAEIQRVWKRNQDWDRAQETEGGNPV